VAITLRVGRRGAVSAPRTRRRAPAPREENPQVSPSGALRLMTLNVAHARRQGRHQVLQSESALRGNLAAIAAVIRRESPDVIALQEADGPSAWSGGFDHVATLAELAGYPHAFRGEHNPFSLGRFDLSSGTALLARVPLGAPRSLAFGESWRDTKGFVAATLSGETIAAPPIDVVSIHLDFLAERVRRRQVERLVDHFRGHDRPLVLMGDFNCEWSERRRCLELLRRELKLRPVDGAGHATFPSWRPLIRLDWILVSDDLAFAGYETLPDQLSDHLGVVAEVRLRGAAPDASVEDDEPTARLVRPRRRARRG
jgi:endonuclease/exonuclease/phosphatase family metal-dependent hydrolase